MSHQSVREKLGQFASRYPVDYWRRAADALLLARRNLSAYANRRLALERSQGPAIVARAPNRAEAEATEARVIDAWLKWYREAFDTVLKLPVDGADDALRNRVAEAKASLR